MSQYAAKHRYRDAKTVRDYDAVRFSTPQGRLTDEVEKRTVRRLAAAFDEGSVILDLACGLGRFAGLALEEGHRVVAADISREMLTEANRRLSKGSRFKGVVLCDAERLPFGDNAFDAVTALRFVGMLPRAVRAGAMREMRRVTRRWVLLNLPNSASAILLLMVVWKLTGQRPQYYPASPRTWRKELATAGLKIVSWHGPLVVPTRRLPKIFLGLARVVNWIAERSYLGHISEQYFVLLEKAPDP